MHPRSIRLSVPLLFLIALGTRCWAAPPDAGIPSLEQDLRAGKFPIRARAARILGYIGGRKQAKALAAMALSDRAREPRIVAAHALAQLGAVRHAPVLHARLQKELSAAPTSSSKSTAARSHRAAVLALLDALATLDPENCASKLAPCLTHNDPPICLGAIRALGKTTDPEAIALLANVAETGSVEERLAAAGALAWRGADATSATAELIARTTDEPSIAEALVSALLCCGGEASVPPLIACLRHPFPEVRARSAKVARLFGVSAAVPELSRACGDVSVPVRNAALLALASIAPNAAENAARQALSSTDPAQRESAVRALRLIATPSATETLMAVARGHDAALVPVSVRAIAERSAPPIRGLLVRLAENGTPEARQAAIEALAWRGDAGAEETLLRVLADPGALEPVWRAASIGLALGSPQPPVPRLAEVAGSDDGAVATRAIITLGLCGTRPATDALCRLRTDGEAARLAQIDALAPLPGSAARSALSSALQDRSPAVRKLATHALVERGPGDLALLLSLATRAPVGLALEATVDESLREAVAAGWLTRARLDEADHSALLAWLAGPRAGRGKMSACSAAMGVALGQADAMADLHALLLGPHVDAQLRRETCQVIGASGCSRLAPLVREYLGALLGPARPIWAAGSGRTHLLRAAIQAAGQLRDADATALLYDGFGEAPGIRAETLRALASIAPEASRDLLRRGCRDESPVVRTAACRLLSDRALPSDAPWLLPMAMDSTTEELQFLAGTLDAWAPDPVIAGLVADADPAVAIGAATALATRIGQAGNSEAALALLHRALTWDAPLLDDDPRRAAGARVYRAAGQTWVEAGRPALALPWLLRAYVTDSSPDNLAPIAACYGHMGNTEAAQTLAARAAWMRLSRD